MPGYTPLPAYQPGGQIDFAPAQNALQQVSQTNARNALMDFQNRELQATVSQRGIENARQAKQDQYALIDRTAQQANAIDQTLPAGSPQRAAAWAAHMAQHQQYFPNDKPTPEEMDPITGPKIYAAQAQLALQNPLDVQAKKAQIGLTAAETAKANAEAALTRAQFAGINDPDEALFGTPSVAPQGATPSNALAAQPSLQPMAPRGPGQSYARGVPSGVPGINVGPPSGPAMAPGVTPNGLPTVPPAGSPTAANGAVMPSSRQNPSYFSPEDKAIYRTALMNPRAAAALEKTPGFQQRSQQAQAVGKNLGNLEERQRAGQELLKNLDDLKGYISSADDDTITNAMGPSAYAKVTPSAVAPLSYQAWTAPKPDNYEELPTRVQANAIYNGTPKDKKYWDFQNGLDHLVAGLTEQFVAGASRGGMQMSDSRQKAFTDTMGALRQATSKAEALKIYEKARTIIGRNFSLPDGLVPEPNVAPAGATPTNSGWSYGGKVGAQ